LLSLSGRDTASGVSGAAFSPDGRHIMTGDAEARAVRVWDVSVSGGAEWANVPTNPGSTSPVAFTPDGRHVVSSGTDGIVTVWDAANGSQTLRIDTHSAPDTLTLVEFQPDQVRQVPVGRGSRPCSAHCRGVRRRRSTSRDTTTEPSWRAAWLPSASTC
jgi:WD40 repeat protein